MPSTLPALTDMTREEARHALSQLRGTEERQKEILLDMYERKAHKALYGSSATWEEFADKEFGVGRARFYQLVECAKVQRSLSSFLDKPSTGSSTILISKFNDEMLLELAKLKEPEKIICAAKEAIDAASTMSYRGKESRFNGQLRTPLVKKIVNRILSAPVPPLVVTTTQPAPDIEEDETKEETPELELETPAEIEMAIQTEVEDSPDTEEAQPEEIAIIPEEKESEKKRSGSKKKDALKIEEKYTRGTECRYVTCRWIKEDEVLRVVFLLPDGTEGAVVVPGGFLP